MIRKSKSGKYEVVIYRGVVDGKKKYDSKTFNTFTQAKDFHARQINFKKNIKDISVSDKVLFSEVARKYIEQCGHKDNTIRSYESKIQTWISPHLGTFQVGNINQITLSRYFQKIKSLGATTGTIYVIHVVLDSIFKFATNSIERYISDNPMEFIPKPHREEPGISQQSYWSKEEAELFLKEAAKTEYFNLFVFMLNTGPRIAEVAAIQKDSIDINSNTLKITRQLSVYVPGLGEEKLNEPAYFLELTKSSRHRIVPLNKAAITAFETEKSKADGRFVFCPGKTEEKLIVLKRGHKCQLAKEKCITNRTVSYVMARICKSAGVKYIGPHGLRHTFSANFLMNGGDIYTLSKLLGHKSVDTTTGYYGHLSHEFLKSASMMVSFGDGI